MYFGRLDILFVLFANTTHAITLSFPSNGCVNPTGMDSCMKSSTQSLMTCVSQCGTDPGCVDTNSCGVANNPCVTSCFCQTYAERLNCALSSCWNKVYSCNYQAIALSAVQICPIAVARTIPFYISDNEGPGACSCNVIRLAAVFVSSQHDEIPCISSKTSGTNICNCCRISEIVSVYNENCNTTAPSAISSFGEIQFGDFENCLPTLGSVDCQNDYGFDTNIGPGFVWPQSAQPIGTGALTDKGSVMTSPLSGATLTWTLFPGEQMTAVAAPFDSKAVASGTSKTTATGTAKTSKAWNLQDTSRKLTVALAGLSYMLFLL
ncbi:hypothetical protein BT63DRAFT_480251 [Microthyrium microscopicum]|uniref:Extracellular membrane protein CFEM domain-containing protein n=1 Tax=Microthyrium microscopicum TaxID=703497 RepID=A0A6A6U4P5_9PEZI|nr:hypothetical protein BT63DRAFT_480251 [Microthyrium microscopicum]